MTDQDIPLTFVDADGRTYAAMSAAALLAKGVGESVVLPHFAEALCGRIDAAAESLRARLMTPGIGQAVEYMEVQAEAVAALNAPANATAPQYPMLAAGIGSDVDPTTKAPAIDVLGVARAVVATHDSWVAVGAAIRKARLGAKAAINAATTIAAASAAYDSTVWPAL